MKLSEFIHVAHLNNKAPTPQPPSLIPHRLYTLIAHPPLFLPHSWAIPEVPGLGKNRRMEWRQLATSALGPRCLHPYAVPQPSLEHFWMHRQTRVDCHEVCVCLADRPGVWQPLMGLCVPHSLIGNICGCKCYSRCRDKAVAETDKVCLLLSPHPSGFYSDRKHCAQFFLKIHSPVVVCFTDGETEHRKSK